jgi:AAA family ATP:ADP antiporter
VARVFFVWLSVFNLFVVSVFWSFMADLFTPDQGVRLFGLVAAGGSLGAMAGPVLTAGLTYAGPVSLLMLASVLWLGACVWCIRRLDRWGRAQSHPGMRRGGESLGGGMWAGMRLVASSPYLLRICLYLFLLTMSATVLYLEQTALIGRELPAPDVRLRLFAGMDLAVNVLTFLTQLWVTNRLVLRFGLAAALSVLPLVSVTGFLGLGLSQALVLFVLFTVVRRVGEYAISKPAREVLFTVVSREEKYKAKNFIDTAVSRGGDASTAWAVSWIKAAGVATAQLVWLMVPVMVLWGWTAWVLARDEARLQRRRSIAP